MTERNSRPRGAVVISTYERFEQYVRAFAAGSLNLLIIAGRRGTGKSQAVRQAAGKNVCWIESNATAFGIYRKLYEHRDDLLVIDDVDSLYSDKAGVRLLKCICQTDPVKNVAWQTATAGQGGAGLPSEFESTSRVAIIANEWKSLSENTAAVEDRGHFVFFEPTAEEVHRKVAEWFWDQEVYDWFADFLHLIPDLSMRDYVCAAEKKESNIDDWVEAIIGELVSPKALLVAQLKADPSFTEERDRVKRFAELGGGGKTTWYKWAKRVKSPNAESLKIRLTKTKPPGRPTTPPLRIVRESAG